ncbi:MAG: TonB-dependent receptor [Acidobacteriota bacterium]
MRNLKLTAILVVAATLVALPVVAQNQNGSLRGSVELADGAAVPGVLVTASSPNLQGTRTTVTTESGQWILRNLTPGAYTVTFELEGMTTVQSSATVSLGQETPVNVEMGVQTETETILVTGELPSVLASSEVSTTYDFETVNALPIGRTPQAIATLAPGLTDNTPNGGQVTISGAFAYDNVFLIDGVDANDNLFGSTNPVFIEDAVADIQVLTSGISAEYGRFTGGVVNVITKSGGNEFSGTLRADLTNDDWRSETPIEEDAGTELQDDIAEVYSGTLGGYVMKDKLWFFAAARDEAVSSQGTLSQTFLPFVNSQDEERYTLKGTLNLADKHQIQGTYTDRDQTGTRPSFGFSATPNTLRTRTDPSDLQVLRYSGILTSSLFLELQASEKTFQFNNTHGLDAAGAAPGSAAFISNSPFFDFFGNFGDHYNAPYFDGRDPENRDNEQIRADLSYFVDTASAGSHDLKIGFEDFSSFRTGGNSQSPTDFVMSADVLTDAAGAPLLTGSNELTPVWAPGASGAWQFLANRNAEVEIATQSLYVNDTWQLNDNWSFNLGFRYEEVEGNSDAGTTTVDSDAFVPRLAATYDVRGDGKYRFDVTYAEYAGKYSEAQFAENTDVGNPPGLLYLYVGAPGQGKDFAPAYDFNNQLGNNYIIVSADDGTQNVLVADDITSPTVEEITLSAGMELDRGGFLKFVYTDREYSDFVEDFVTTATGSTDVVVLGTPAGTFSNTLFDNSDLPVREYEAIQLIGRYRISDSLTLDGNYTHQITNDGNFEGEGTNTPGTSTVIGDYPEIRSQFNHFPEGRLNDFAEHKIRLWTTYNLNFNRAGNLSIGFLMNFDTGRVFTATDSVGITAIQNQILDDLGYVDGPTSQTLFFGERGNVEFDDALTFDLSFNYTLNLFSDFELWIKADVFNILDEDAQLAGRSAVDANFDGPLDSFGLPTTFTTPANFERARNNADFVAPREYQFTVGFRF